MPILYSHVAPTEPGAPKRFTRHATLNGALKLVAAGWVIGGPLGSLAACASGVPPQQTPTPSPTQLRRITPENARTIRTIALLQPMNGVLRAAAVAADGGIIATGGTTDAQLWDTRMGALRKKLVGHTEQIYGMAWSPDSAMVASGRESGIVRLWDAHAGSELALLQGHTDAIWGLAWAPDGARLVSASDDGTARIWGVVGSS
jgi:WD40 repeat protein